MAFYREAALPSRALNAVERAQELEKFKAQLRTGLSISAEQHEQILNKLGQDVQRFGCAAFRRCVEQPSARFT